MPYIAKLEKAGIPTVIVDLPDMEGYIQHRALESGIANARYVHSSRTLPGPEDADALIKPVIDGLTRPLTAKEKESSQWKPPSQQRILFEGTLDEAQAFYQQTERLPGRPNAPYAVYTDGFPIIVPTEEKVQEMLKGTSHKPDELITLQSDKSRAMGYEGDSTRRQVQVAKKGDVVRFLPMSRTATVEHVAVNAVMAGCKPEYFPVVLAIAEAGAGSGDGRNGSGYCVSGPFATEIGMNYGFGVFGPGNPASKTIGRTSNLMWRNLGGAIPGVTVVSDFGNPIMNGGFCFSEDADSLPPGWKGLNEEFGFEKNESIVMVMGAGAYEGRQFRPGGYRALQKSGHGAMAHRLDVWNQPGPHNWLEYILPRLWNTREHGLTFIMVPTMAQHLYEYGFKSKEEIYEWLWKKSFEPMKDFRLRSGNDVETNGWMGVEKISGKHWRELPDDYMVPVAGYDPFNNCIIVCGGSEEESDQMGGRGRPYSIDAWR